MDSPLTEEQSKYVQVFRRAGEDLLRIINDILDFSKLEAGQAQLETIVFSLRNELAAVFDIMAFKAEEKKIALSWTIGNDIEDELLGDPLRLKQILFNLVGNALKFTAAGSIGITVEKFSELPSQEPDTVTLRFTVKDTGIGMAPHVLERIFDKFTQADSSMSRKFGGTGLGLAICKQLVTLMKGKIWAESKEGAGSAFHFTVTLNRLQQRAVPKTGEEKTGLRPGTFPYDAERPLHILIAEDNEDNRLLLQSYLKKFSHHLEMAVNGREAVDKIRSGKKYDVVFMDVQMPVMDGYTATRQIRNWETRNNLQPTIIVALTAHALQEDEQKSIAAGCNGHLTKPIKKQEFLAALQKYANKPTH